MYEIRFEGGRLFFHQDDLNGELIKEGEWLVAKLTVGTIRVSKVGEEMISNFKSNGKTEWQADTTAGRERKARDE